MKLLPVRACMPAGTTCGGIAPLAPYRTGAAVERLWLLQDKKCMTF
ncbi:MAG: hypothetical protein QMD03_09540 [Syntrophales bacterium]|nr:hypothetical protein [Syntrophales bacterium]